MIASRPSTPLVSEQATSVLSHPLSLRRGVAWTLVGNAVYAASQWIILVAIAQLGSAEMVGQFALGMAVTTPVMILANMVLREIQATDADNHYAFGSYLALRCLTAGTGTFIVAIMALLGAYRTDTALVIMGLGIAKAIDSISDIVYGYLEKQESFDLVALFRISSSLLSVVFVSAGICITGGLVGSVASLAAISVIRLILLELPLITWRHQGKFCFRPVWSRRPLLQLIVMAAPLGLVAMMLALNSSLPRYLLQFHHGEAQLGIFAALSCFAAIGTQFVESVGKAASPRLSRYFATGAFSSYYRLLTQLSLLGAIVGVLGVASSYWFGKHLLLALYSSDFSAHAGLLPWIMLEAAFRYLASLVGIGLTASRHFQIIPIIGGGVLVSQSIASLLLIQQWGMKGAAWSVLTGTVCNLLAALLCLFLLCHKVHRRTQSQSPISPNKYSRAA